MNQFVARKPWSALATGLPDPPPTLTAMIPMTRHTRSPRPCAVMSAVFPLLMGIVTQARDYPPIHLHQQPRVTGLFVYFVWFPIKAIKELVHPTHIFWLT